MTPLVSIIIPTYNRSHLIGETLDSVIAQTYSNWECIVVDDGSTDNTAELLEFYCEREPRMQYYNRPQNRPKGANACRNYGFEVSKGEYVNWVDDDDILLKDCLFLKLKEIQPHHNFIICSGYYVDAFLKNKKLITINESANLYKDYVLWKLQIITNSILFKKAYLEEQELFSSKISRGQETEFFSRIFYNSIANSYRILNIPLFYYRQHQETKSTRNVQYIKSHKESQTFIAIENFKKGIVLKDIDLIQFNYNSLINFLLSGLDNDHLGNSKYILKKLLENVKNLNKTLYWELVIFGNLVFLLRLRSYRMEKRFRFFQFRKV